MSTTLAEAAANAIPEAAVLLALDGAAQDAGGAATVQHANCLNCDAQLARPMPRYCGDCGQETNVRPPTLMEFFQQFGGSYIAMEGALWRTLWRLLCLPGQLTLEYFAGRRRRYVLPLRLYLTISVVALLVMRLVSSAQIDAHGQDALKLTTAEMKNFYVISAGPTKAGLRDGKFFCENLPQSLCDRLRQRLTLNPEGLANEIRQMPDRFFGHLGSSMFVLVPLFALWLRLLYLGRGRRYTEHLVFALHLHAFWFVMLLLMLTGNQPLSFAALLAITLYPLVALHRVYRTRWWSTGLRAFALFLLYTVTLAFALVAVVIWALLS